MESQDIKFLTFFLNSDEYAIPIIRVKEIIGVMDITTIPETPNFMKGIINLRGKLIPVIDLRLKLELTGIDYTERTCIIVVEVYFGCIKKYIGVLVDSVSEVINIPSTDIEYIPECVNQYDIQFLDGIGKLKDKVILILSVDKIVNIEKFSFNGSV